MRDNQFVTTFYLSVFKIFYLESNHNERQSE